MRVERRIVEHPLTVTADIPDGWGEIETPGLVLLVVGPPAVDGSAAPTLQVGLDRAESPDVAWRALRDGVAQLPEARVAAELRRPTDTGEEQVAEVVHAGPVGGTQWTAYRLLVDTARSLVTTVVVTCGGASPASERDELRVAAASVRVQVTDVPHP